MTFIWPTLLWSLIVIPLLTILYARMQERRRLMARQYGNMGFVQQVSGKRSNSRRHLPALLFLAGLSILLTALARPQMMVGLPKAEGTVILAFDVSGSMSADDFKPTRMEAAKAVAKDFVQRQPTTVQIGVVAFSDSAFSVQQPTNDQAAITAAIDRLRPQRGTSLANGIIIALNTIAVSNGDPPLVAGGDASSQATPTPAPPQSDRSDVIVLFTDGENNMDPDPLAAALLASQYGVRIHTIGIGSPTGTTLTVNGFTVFTQLDEAMLQQISDITKGLYFNAQTQDDLSKIYEQIEPRLKVEQAKTEVTAIFAGASILILLIGGMLSLLWFSHLP